MRFRLLATMGALAVSLGGLLSAASPAVADPAHCYGWDNHPDRVTSGGWRFGDGTAIRRGPYTDCDAFGRGYPTQGIDVHCHVTNGNGVIWVYVRNTTTGVNGWAAASTIYATDSGASTAPC